MQLAAPRHPVESRQRNKASYLAWQQPCSAVEAYFVHQRSPQRSIHSHLVETFRESSRKPATWSADASLIQWGPEPASLLSILVEKYTLPSSIKTLSEPVDDLRVVCAVSEPQSPARPDFRLEQQWIEKNRAVFGGMWVALCGDYLIASGTSAKEVYLRAKDAGVRSPLVTRVEPVDEAPFGGW